MKTQILKLESYDNAASVRDKMTWGTSSRILLVWPLQGRILTRELDLVLLVRQARTLGTQIGLVTLDGEVRKNAGRLGIPYFTSQSEARQGMWPESTTISNFPCMVPGKKLRGNLTQTWKKPINPGFKVQGGARRRRN